MRGEKALQPGRQPIEREGEVGPDVEQVLLFRGEELAGAQGQELEGVLHRRQIAPAGFRQPQAARPPEEQRLAQQAFQVANLLAHRRLGDVELFSRRGETEAPGRRFEGTQPVQRGQSAAHFGPPFSRHN